jgi:hypothetical protein
VSGLIQVSPSANEDTLRRRLEALGATVQSWSTRRSLMSIRIPSSKLLELGDVDEVVYVEGGDRYSLS